LAQLRAASLARQYNLALEGSEVRNFLGDDVFDPGTVSILMAAFDGAWQSIKANGPHLSERQSELVRATLAKYIIEQARQGELDQVRLRDGALLHLAQSNLRNRPPARK
jgi:hypothetical protein